MKLYIKTDESENPIPTGNVGIWWLYNNKVIGDYCPVDEGVEDRGYIQFSKTDNHITRWETTIKEQLPEAIDLISKGYAVMRVDLAGFKEGKEDYIFQHRQGQR